MHLVTRGHLRSRDKDGGHTIGSSVVKNPILHANFVAVCYIEPKLLTIIVHYGNRDIGPFCSCDLDLDPVTFIYELDPCPVEIYRMCENELLMSRFVKAGSTANPRFFYKLV